MTATSFDTVLVANRGEIACRIIRTLHARGLKSVAVYSDADAGARHVRLADTAVRLGPAPAAESYLDIDKVLAAARSSGAQAIHPGYGFLAENAAFARACADAGIVFIGPSAAAIETMGDKIAAKLAVEARGVPTVPGIARPGLTDADLIDAAPGIGYPLLIKPSAGGGGKGMHVVERADDLPAALVAARREAAASFGDDTLFLERYVLRPRHIEVQILADAHGTVIHLGERECSLQRRHQKVIEEAPSPLLDAATRARIGAAACETARSVDYRGAGTVEFLVAADRPDEFFFMEMNTRLQVEHPVTEEVTGVDLVAEQLRIAEGLPLSLTQDEVTLTGHSIEARVYAEDPRAGFLPTGGHVDAVHRPTGAGIRVDTSLDDGLDVSIDYDPMLAKIIATGADRDEARRRLLGALADTAVFGVTTNVAFLRLLLEHPDVAAGRLDTGLIERALGDLRFAEPDERLYAEAALVRAATAPRPDGAWGRLTGWRLGGVGASTLRLAIDGADPRPVTVRPVPGGAEVRVGDGPVRSGRAQIEGDRVRTLIDGVPRDILAHRSRDALALAVDGDVFTVRLARSESATASVAGGTPHVESPMPGTVVQVAVVDGDRVEIGDAVVAVEAMKMEHVVRAAVAGVVSVQVAVGDQVARGQTLVVVTPDADGDATDFPES